MSKTKFVVVRHGETEWNVTMQLQGHKNSPLTALGKKQVAASAEILKNKTFDALVLSDLQRVVKTTEIINKYHHLEMEFNEGLRERNFGIMEGLTRNQVSERYPETYEMYMSRNLEYIVPDGESLQQFNNRVIATFEELAIKYEGKTVLTITHGGVLDTIIRKIFSYPLNAPRKYRLYNASINTFVIQKGHWILEEWGIVAPNENLKPKDDLAAVEIK